MGGGGFVDCLDVDGDGGYGGDWCYQFDNAVLPIRFVNALLVTHKKMQSSHKNLCWGLV